MAHAERDLETFLDEASRRKAAPPEPGGFYSAEGDCIFFYREAVPHRAERINSLLTVYRAEDDRRVVGVQIKGIKNLIAQAAAGLVLEQQRQISLVPLIVEAWRADPAAQNGSQTTCVRTRSFDDTLRAFSPVVAAEGFHAGTCTK